jgi:hypothetical protein
VVSPQHPCEKFPQRYLRKYGIFSHFAKQLLPLFYFEFLFQNFKAKRHLQSFSNNSTSSASKVFLTGVKLKLPIFYLIFFKGGAIKDWYPRLSASSFQVHYEIIFNIITNNFFPPRIATPTGPFLVAHPYY